MLSQKRVRAAIDASEEVFLWCIRILLRLKRHEIERHELLDFQPRLACALFDLAKLRHEASHEKRRLRARETSLSPKWLGHRLALLDLYKHKLDFATERGKVLGDNFAWLFYCRDELHLLEHLEHEATSPIPSGVGGIVEVDFVRNFPLIEGRFLLIYHGTTTLLRVGDFSLIDMAEGRLAGLGELKTGPVEDGQVRVALSIIGSGEHFKPVNSSEGERKDHPFPLRSPERFKRQMQRMVGVATASPPTEKRHFRLGVNYSSFEGVLHEAISSGLAFRKVSDSLAIAVAAARPSLSKRMRSQLQGLPQKLYPLFTENLEDNALWQGDLVLRYLPGTTPLLWTGMPSDLIEGMFQEHVAVMTFYNPARFIQHLRALGFEVSIVKGEATLSIIYFGEDLKLEVQGSEYFLSLIQNFLVDELSVAEAINGVVRDAVSGRYGRDVVITWKPMQLHPEVENLRSNRPQAP